jgi:hypothetical protein
MRPPIWGARAGLESCPAHAPSENHPRLSLGLQRQPRRDLTASSCQSQLKQGAFAMQFNGIGSALFTPIIRKAAPLGEQRRFIGREVPAKFLERY